MRNVLINRWARPRGQSCPSHTGRQWPASFIVRIDPHKSVPLGVIRERQDILPIDERGEKIGGRLPEEPIDVFHCSGHAPLADGRFFTGGARFSKFEFNKFGENQMQSDEDITGQRSLRMS